jgi:hypothetical protein
MADLYSLVHREAGRLGTFLSRGEAEAARDDVLRDEPDWIEDLTVEPFDFIIAEHAER